VVNPEPHAVRALSPILQKNTHSRRPLRLERVPSIGTSYPARSHALAGRRQVSGEIRFENVDYFLLLVTIMEFDLFISSGGLLMV
jgi:hypothetical protein